MQQGGGGGGSGGGDGGGGGGSGGGGGGVGGGFMTASAALKQTGSGSVAAAAGPAPAARSTKWTTFRTGPGGIADAGGIEESVATTIHHPPQTDRTNRDIEIEGWRARKRIRLEKEGKAKAARLASRQSSIVTSMALAAEAHSRWTSDANQVREPRVKAQCRVQFT
jgi:hypothetical protein